MNSSSSDNNLESSFDNLESNGRTPRLNKNHGFMKMIIHNQIERDEYHKMLEERRQKRVSEEQEELARKMQEMNIYIPPHRRNGRSSKANEASTSTRSSDPHCHTRERVRRSLQKQLEESSTESNSSYTSSNSTSSWRSDRRPTKNAKSGYLFLLNITDDLEIPVHKTDTPQLVADYASEKLKFDEETKKRLVTFLEKEFKKYCPEK